MIVEEEVTLKRDLGAFGSFSIGYADVGADIYIALGLVLFFGLGAAPLALACAAVGYAFTALSYAELAPAIPVVFKPFANYPQCYETLGAMAKLRCKRGCRDNGGRPSARLRIVLASTIFQGVGHVPTLKCVRNLIF